MNFEIDTTALNADARDEMAKLLFKCGYSVRLVKRKIENKLHYFIVCEVAK